MGFMTYREVCSLWSESISTATLAWLLSFLAVRSPTPRNCFFSKAYAHDRVNGDLELHSTIVLLQTETIRCCFPLACQESSFSWIPSITRYQAADADNIPRFQAVRSNRAPSKYRIVLVVRRLDTGDPYSANLLLLWTTDFVPRMVLEKHAISWLAFPSTVGLKLGKSKSHLISTGHYLSLETGRLSDNEDMSDFTIYSEFCTKISTYVGNNIHNPAVRQL